MTGNTVCRAAPLAFPSFANKCRGDRQKISITLDKVECRLNPLRGAIQWKYFCSLTLGHAISRLQNQTVLDFNLHLTPNIWVHIRFRSLIGESKKKSAFISSETFEECLWVTLHELMFRNPKIEWLTLSCEWFKVCIGRKSMKDQKEWTTKK